MARRFDHAVYAKSTVGQRVDVQLQRAMEASRRATFLAWVRLHGHRKRCEVAIDASIDQLSPFVPSPAALPRHPEGGMCKEDHHAATRFQDSGSGAQDLVERVHVLQAKKKHDRIE